MFALYYKEFYIIPDPMIKNRTCQTTRNKQIAICEDKKPLDDYISKQKDKNKYFVEKMGY